MYGHESKPSRVYKYGAKPPAGSDAEFVRQQIDAGWRYRNDLVALELDRRRRAEEIIRKHDPEIAALDGRLARAEGRLTEVRERIRERNQDQRDRDPAPALRQEAREIKQHLAELRGDHKRLRRAMYAKDSPARPALDVLDDETRDEAKRLRADNGLHWGTYLTIEQSLSGIRSGAPPRFVRRADWGGQVAVQIQGGASWDELVDGHGQARVEIEPLPEGATPGGRRSKRPYARLYIRVGSEGPGNRTPIWACVRFVLHRRIPADGRIKWIKLVRQRQGTDERWSVQFVVARDQWAYQDTTEASGTVAVHLGYRRLDDGSLRVAVAEGEDGWRDELTIPPEQWGRWSKATDLRSIRDREFDEARDALSLWLSETEDLPEWLREATRTLDRWRSQARLAALVIRWRQARFPGDTEGYDAVEAWRVQDKHLYDWEAASRAGFRRWRKDHYRRWVASLRWRYERLVVDDTDWAELRRRDQPEDATEPERLNRREQAATCSPGDLRLTVQQGHPSVEVVDARGITQTCALCGADPHPEWDRISEIEYRCEAGHRMDQDRNAALNMLARASGEVVAG